jgi:hypothetical protein
MAIYYDSTDLKSETYVRAADISFLAGNPHYPVPPPFEHVALVAESKTLRDDAAFLNLKVYALPESEDGSASVGLQFSTVQYWRDSFSRGNEIAWLGDSRRGWNMLGRARLAPKYATALTFSNGHLTGRYKYKLGAFSPKLKANGVYEMNCLGFVCHMLSRKPLFYGALVETPLLAPEFPRYQTGRLEKDGSPQMRNFPSVGHLAVSLERSDQSIPYCPASPEEASAHALAQSFLRGRMFAA